MRRNVEEITRQLEVSNVYMHYRTLIELPNRNILATTTLFYHKGLQFDHKIIRIFIQDVIVIPGA